MAQDAADMGAQPNVQAAGPNSAEFFLSNYRLGKTLGIGSFGKVIQRRSPAKQAAGESAESCCCAREGE